MKNKLLAVSAILPVLAACDVPNDASRNVNLPESVVAMAAPNQDLSSAVILPEDGCYWYQHQGPVETTLLPLRTKEGRPICTRS